MKRLLLAAVVFGALAAIPSTASAWNGPEPVCVPDGQGGYTTVTMSEQEFANAPSGSLYPVPAGGCPAPPPPPPVNVTVCRDGQTVTVLETEQLPSDTAGECKPVPPPPVMVDVCRDGANTIHIPEDQVLPTDVRDACIPPVPPPAIVNVCRNGEVIQVPENATLPSDIPDSCPIEVTIDVVGPDADTGTPVQVEGKEQAKHPHGGEVSGPSNQVAADTLPFTGGPVLPPALAGSVLLALGGVARRRLGR